MKLKTPLAIINFKAFAQSTGKNAVNLAQACDKCARETGISVAIAVQPADISQVARAVSIPVLAQHVDVNFQGAFTGSVLAESVLNAGAVGSLVNHSEKPLDLAEIKKTILRLRDSGLCAIACAGSSEMAFEIAKFNPDFIAIEPPELIGGTIAVSQSKPEVITAVTSRIKRMPILCGAGIHEKNDVKKSFELGVKGILVASAVVCAKSPEKALMELLEGFS